MPALDQDSTRRAARRMRHWYRVASALWVAALAAWGCWLLLRSLT